MKKHLILTLVTAAGSFFVNPAGAQTQEHKALKIKLLPPPVIAACLPRAVANVTVFPREDTRGVDTLDLKAHGLPPNTSFTVFLTELPTLPIGAVQYIADFTTNAEGNGSVRVDAIIEEAFALDATTGVRKELNSIVIWFADPAGDDVCFGPGGGPISPFDGDGEAGIVALASQASLP